MTWLVIGALFLATVALKGAGPLGVGAREPSERALGVTSLLAPALLAGLVVYETFGAPDGAGIVFDERLGGLAAATLALLLRLPMLVVILVAAVATAALRLV
jgi:hypothetical protein